MATARVASILDERPELTELHSHVGGAVDPAIMWSIAHQAGIKLPSKDYWQFVELISVSHPDKVNNLAEYDLIFRWTELIQSSPMAIERSVYEIIGGAYRRCNITTLELRFNPLKRNRGGERDLDHIISAALRGQDRALLEYPQVRAGLILMMDRTFTPEINAVVIELTDYATPCKTIRESFVNQEFVRVSHTLHPGESRVYARILREGVIRPGDSAQLLPPDIF